MLLSLVVILLCSQSVLASDLILAKQVSMESKFLKETRNLLIKLPENYDSETSTYPVLYLLHGQWDMLTAVSTLDLIKEQLPEFILVGIESKGKELRPKKGEITPFSHYLSLEVIPFVENNYSVAPFSILSGHSNSGRFVLDYWLEDSELFSQYYAFSPSLEDGYIVDRASKLTANILQSKAPLTLTIADEGEHMQVPFDSLSQLLSKQKTLPFAYKKFPEQSHRTSKHTSMLYALQTTFTGWIPSYETKVGGVKKLSAHYSNLTAKYGFRVDVPTETLQRITAYYATSDKEGDISNLKQTIEFTLNQSNTGSEALFEIVDYLSTNGYEQAGEFVLKSICDYSEKLERCQA